jgi:glyoxylase-like metal-dependent hydrolase (beta-lactamase superfamily II)
MEVQQLAEGLWRWTGVHPQWQPGPDEELPPEVGCVYYEAEDAVVLIDPLVPPEAREHFLDSLDRDVERARRPIAILLTCPWHGRSAGELAERYGAGIWMHGEDPRQPLEGARQFEFGDTLLGGVKPFDAHFHGEALFWVPSHRTLVAGDVLSAPSASLRLAPDEWLAPEERGGRMRESLRFLLDLPVERVLVGHGEPVLVDAREALEHAFQAASSE